MRRLIGVCALGLTVCALGAEAALAEVKTREKVQVKFEGMLGRMVGLFGGRAARDGIVTTTALRGDRKATFSDQTGRIVDLAEQKVYELDIKKKTYTVTTFDELRRQMREAQERAEREAKKEQGREQEPAAQQSGKEVEVDFDLKDTGQKRSIAGYDARQVVMTVTVREKGKTLEEAGGLVMTSDSWLGPDIPAMKELAAFEQRYWQAVAPETAAVSAEQMAAVIAMYPMVQQAMERMNREKVSMEGTLLASTTVFEGVKSKAQLSEENQSTAGGGIGGLLARRVAKRNDSPRATILTLNMETLEVATSVAPGDLQIPDGFTEKR